MGWFIFNLVLTEDHVRVEPAPKRTLRLEINYALSDESYGELQELFPLARPPKRDEGARARIMEILGAAAEEEGADPNLAPSEACLYEVLFGRD